MCTCRTVVFFFFNDTATTEIYTLSLHDALPILIIPPSARPLHAARRAAPAQPDPLHRADAGGGRDRHPRPPQDRKSTRLNSSHANISYAVFCLKKKKTITHNTHHRHVCTITLTI